VAEAEQAIDAANSLLLSHEGFDDDGQVIDMDLARDTVHALEENITSARVNIMDAIRGVVEGLREYREINDLEEE